MSNSLTEVDAKGNIQPDLATSFEPADKDGDLDLHAEEGRDLP